MSASPSAERIALIGGTGDLGFGLALRWAAAGIPVMIGSRDPERARDAAGRLTEILRGSTAASSVEGLENPAAAAAASIVVLTVPFPAQAATIKSIRDSLRDCVLVDATVPLEATVGGKPTRVLRPWHGSAAEQARDLVPPAVPVVAAFHNISAEALQDAAAPLDCDVLVCGDDAAAKLRLLPLIDLIPGLRAVDAGALEMARIVEPITALLISINRRYKVRHAGIRISGLPQSP